VTGHHGHDRPDETAALRARLAGIDPTRPGGPACTVDPPPGYAEELIMATTDRHVTDRPSAAGSEARRIRSPGRRRRLAVGAAAALVLVAAGVAGGLALRGPGPTATVRPPAVALSVPGGGPAIGSCIRFDVQLLAQMPVAFAGTVTSLTDGTVTLAVDRWYQGTATQQRAEVVTLAVPDAATSVALDGVAFEQGQHYLLAATDGTVNGCGYSGPAGAELGAAYQQAFGG
jgi:hypothetical protein